MRLDHEQLCQLIPHAGTMCLLDSVSDWDEESIRCRAISQALEDNPLRHNGVVAAINGVEYAAQAMAIHGALLDDDQESPSIGYLAAVRGVKLESRSLHQESELLISCHRLAGDANGFIYEFEVNGDSSLLLSGRATVIIQASTNA